MVTIDLDKTAEIEEVLNRDNIFVITDSNIIKIYPQYFNDKTYILPAGENSKSFKSAENILSGMLSAGCNRKTTVVAVGGGVVGDIAGFCAAVFMRGVKWINIPTSLLSQIDSSVGGKTAVNLGGAKNMIGAFLEPQEVLISVNFLLTLPEREKLSGMGEIIKTAILHKPLFDYFEKNSAALFSYDLNALLQAVKMCIDFKLSIVKEDPFEITGRRKILNLGHTIGHALEKEGNFALSHGEYVLWGLLIEAYICRNYMKPEFYLYVKGLLKKVLKGREIEFDCEKVAKAALGDKKNDKSKISIIMAYNYDEQKELFFTESDIRSGVELWKKESVK